MQWVSLLYLDVEEEQNADRLSRIGRATSPSFCCIERWRSWYTHCSYVGSTLYSLTSTMIDNFTCLFSTHPVTQPTPDDLRKAIRETRKLTNKPFGVNITMLPAIVPPDYEGFARAAIEEGEFFIL